MSKSRAAPTLYQIELELHSEASATLSAKDAKGLRYHVWVKPVDPLILESECLYVNPPERLERGDPGYFDTRRFPFKTRFKNMDAIIEQLLQIARSEGLLAKAIETYGAKTQAETAQRAEERRQRRIEEHALQTHQAAKALVLSALQLPPAASGTVNVDLTLVLALNEALKQAESG